jgi:putative nucleotidyltransferase with HDIG domain
MGAGTMKDKLIIRKIFFDDCEAGMQIASDLYSGSKSLIVPAGTILDEYSLARIAKFKIALVEVFEPAPEICADKPKPKPFEHVYSVQVGKIRNIFESLENGNPLRMEEIRTTVKELVASDIGNRDILHTLNSLRSSDEYTYTHSLNVGILAMMLARWSGHSEAVTKQICYAGVLHDIGKSRISMDIIKKPGKLTVAEYEAIKMHPVEGYNILKKCPVLAEDIRQGVLMHHERLDGSGYPLRVKGPKIHEYGKIVAIADVFDAMVSDRCYCAKESPFSVLAHFKNQFFQHLDVKYLDIFVQKMSVYYLGERVRLSDGSEGEVVYINPQKINHPIVQINGRILDLADETTIAINGLALA